MHNWSADINYPNSRSCPMIGSFLLGFIFCDGRERDIIYHIQMLVDWLIFLGFHIVTTGNVF
jgi:hypothetical protein